MKNQYWMTAPLLIFHFTVAAAPPRKPEPACVVRLNPAKTLELASRRFMDLEWNKRYRDYQNERNLPLWLQRYSEFVAVVGKVKPSDVDVLENFDAFLQAAFFSMEYQWIRGPNAKMDGVFEAIVRYMQQALLSKAAVQRQIQKTVLTEWNEKLGSHVLAIKLGRLKRLVESQIGLERIEDAFMLYNIQRELARALIVRPDEVREFKYFPDTASTSILNLGNTDSPKVAGQRLHLLVLELTLMLRTSEWSGLNEEQFPQLTIVRRLQSLDFSGFLAAFPAH